MDFNFSSSEDESKDVNSQLDQTLSPTITYKYQISTEKQYSADEIYPLIQAYLQQKQCELNCIKVKMEYVKIENNQNQSSQGQKNSEKQLKAEVKKSIDKKYFQIEKINSLFKYPSPLDKYQKNLINDQQEEEFNLKLNSKECKRFPFINAKKNQLDKYQQFNVEIQGEVLGFNKINIKEIQGFHENEKERKQVDNSILNILDNTETIQATSLGAYAVNKQQQLIFEDLYNLGEEECSFMYLQETNMPNQNIKYSMFLNFRSVGLVKIELINPKVEQIQSYNYIFATSTPMFYATTSTYQTVNFVDEIYEWHSIHNVLLTLPQISTFMKVYSAENFALKLSLKDKQIGQTKNDEAFSKNIITQYITSSLDFKIQYLLLVLLSNKKIDFFEISSIEQQLKKVDSSQHYFFLNNLMNRMKGQKITEFLQFQDNQEQPEKNYQQIFRVVVSPSKFIFHLPSYEYNSYLIKELQLESNQSQNIVRIMFERSESDFIQRIFYRQMLIQFNILSKHFCYLGKQNNEALLIEVQLPLQNQENNEYFQKQYNVEMLNILQNVGDYSQITDLNEQQMTINQALWKSLLIEKDMSDKSKKISESENDLEFGIISLKQFDSLVKQLKKGQNISQQKINCLLLQINGCTSLFFSFDNFKEETLMKYQNLLYIIPKKHCNHQTKKRNRLYLIDYNKPELGWISQDTAQRIQIQLGDQLNELLSDQDQIYNNINQLLPYDDILAQQSQRVFRENYYQIINSKYNLSQDYFFTILKNILKDQILENSQSNKRLYPKNCYRLFSFQDQLGELKADQVFVQVQVRDTLKVIEGPVILINENERNVVIKKVTAVSDLFNIDIYKKYQNIIIASQQSKNLFNHKERLTLIYGENLNKISSIDQVIPKDLKESKLKHYNDQEINIENSVKRFLEMKEFLKEPQQSKMEKFNIMDYFSKDQLFLKYLLNEVDQDTKQAYAKMFQKNLGQIKKHSKIFNQFIQRHNLGSNFQIFQLLFENRNNTNIQVLLEFENIIVNFADEVFEIYDLVIDGQQNLNKCQFYIGLAKNIANYEIEYKQDIIESLTHASGICYLCLYTCIAYIQSQDFPQIAQLIQEKFQLDITHFKKEIQNIQEEEINEGLLGFFWILSVQLCL